MRAIESRLDRLGREPLLLRPRRAAVRRRRAGRRRCRGHRRRWRSCRGSSGRRARACPMVAGLAPMPGEEVVDRRRRRRSPPARGPRHAVDRGGHDDAARRAAIVPGTTLPDDVHAAGGVDLGRRERERSHRRNRRRREERDATHGRRERSPRRLSSVSRAISLRVTGAGRRPPTKPCRRRRACRSGARAAVRR